jgi:shikimate dehydrogenase
VTNPAALIRAASASSAHVLGLIGDPLVHTLSPAMHDAAYLALGVDARYVALPTQDLPGTLDVLRRADRVVGFGVTHPFKTRILAHLDVVDPVARTIGAVNTVIRRGTELHGFNTDWLGARAGLRTFGPLADRHHAVIGAGGAARAIAYAVKAEGGSVTIVHRGALAALALARDLGAVCVPLPALGDVSADVLANATPVGGLQEPGRSLVPPQCLARFAGVADVVYNPIETRLLRDARERGIPTENGVTMVVAQAVEQIRLWLGLEPDAARMRAVLLERLSPQPSSRRVSK